MTKNNCDSAAEGLLIISTCLHDFVSIYSFSHVFETASKILVTAAKILVTHVVDFRVARSHFDRIP